MEILTCPECSEDVHVEDVYDTELVTCESCLVMLRVILDRHYDDEYGDMLVWWLQRA